MEGGRGGGRERGCVNDAFTFLCLLVIPLQLN